MNRIVLVALLFSPLIHASECDLNETLIASCELPGKVKRVAAFCANKQDDTIKYTFKNGDSLELVVNFNKQHKLKRWLDLGTYTTYLGFTKGEYSYVLSVPEEKPGMVAQLDVRKNDQIISTKQCNENSFGEEGVKINSIEDVSDSSVRDSGFKFP